ncbi:MAG TPA: DegT/DnrJ/EryC1/StrS family aminotransferase, partial [Chryseolinea sp.]|nr:DegT/DnrJ/EryC1/StrS family aminotransferase [Chryseolinea sp.]
ALFTNTPFCIGVGNGHDALFIALKACGIGSDDEVIVPAHTFIATWLAVTRTGAKIIPLDSDGTFNIDIQKLEGALSDKTKAIIPVHLYGQPCNMTAILAFSKKHGIFVIEDNAQAHGAAWQGQLTGSFGDINATSFYPVKNLGALGDGGALTTRNFEFAQYARRYRNYGFEIKNVSSEKGMNSRLDEIQAAVLGIKLKHVHRWNEERIRLANLYLKMLEGIGDVRLPISHPEALHVYHLFVIRTAQRDALRIHLANHHVETMIHYPIPPHLQKSFKDLGYKKGDYPIAENIANTALSLPLWPGLKDAEVEYVCEVIKKFYAS